MLESLRRNVTWRAIPFAGIAAGTAHLIVNLILMPLLFQVDGSLLIRYFSSLVLGEQAITSDNGLFLLVGIVVHYVISILFALLIAIIVHRWGLLVGIILGAAMGIIIYVISLYVGTLIFPWFYAMNQMSLLIAHIVFGAVAGGVYELFDHFDTPLFDTGEVAT